MVEKTPYELQKHSEPGKLSRRGFLRIIAGIGIVGWVGGPILKNLGETPVIRQTRNAMGTIINLTVMTPKRKNVAAAETAVNACFEHMSELEALLSRFKPDSQVSLLNNQGILKAPHPSFLELLRQAHWISELSAGLFDVSILPLVALYQSHHVRDGGLPDAIAIDAACSKVDYRRLAFNNDQLTFDGPGMAVTLDGIAKGYIVDEGARKLREHGISNFLLEAGGDIVVSGRPGFDRLWKVGIQDPRGNMDDLVVELDLSDQAVATSGDYMQPFTSDFSEHHILNPRTGNSSSVLASATVIAPQLALADALATTLMVMEPDMGLELVKKLNIQAVLITKEGKIIKT